jgi:hypothetical protein
MVWMLTETTLLNLGSPAHCVAPLFFSSPSHQLLPPLTNSCY